LKTLACFAIFSTWAIAQSPATIRQAIDTWDVPSALSQSRSLLDTINPTPSLQRAQALDLLGESLSLAADPSALPTLNQALEMKTALLPPGNIALTHTFLLIAAEHSLRRQWPTAMDSYQKSLAILDAHPETEADQLLPRVLLGLGAATNTLGKNKEAKSNLDQALKLAEAQTPANKRLLSEILSALSTAAYLENNFTLAEQYLERSKAVAPPDPVDQTRLLFLSAGLAMERGRFEEAAAGFNQTLAFFTAKLGSGNRRLLPVLRNIARCHRFQGRFQEAIQASETALALSVSTFGENSPPTAELLGVLAAAKAESGYLSEARQLYDRALAVLTSTLGPSHSQVGFELFSLANLEQVMGDFETSLRHATQALAIRETVDGKQSARTASIYALLGRVNALNGNPVQGRQFSELAVAIGRRSSGDAHPRTVFAISDLGEVLYRAKDYTAAHRLFTESLAGQIKLFGPGSIRTAQGEYNLGLAERALGHHPEALDRFTKAGRIWREAFGPDYLFLAETNAGQAASLIALDRPAEALEPALEAARVRRLSLAAVSMSAAEREALLFARVDRDGLLLAIDLAGSGRLDPAAISRVWDAVIRDRAYLLDSMARRRPPAGAGPATQALMARISSLKKDLAQSALVGDPKIYLSRVTNLRQSLDDAERQLARQSGLLARQSSDTRAGLQEVLAATPPGSAVVGYARAEASYVAFLGLAGSSSIRAIPLGSLATIDARVHAWQQEMERERNSAGRNARRNEASYRQAGLALRRAIWDPLSPHLSAAKTVFAVPDGELQLLNLDTLPVGNTQYLAETGPLFQMLSSERDLVAPPPAPVQKGKLLALANPIWANPTSAQLNAPSTCTDLDGNRFPPLPGSTVEAQSIRSLWSARGGSSQILSGATASESALKNLAAGNQVLHLATHGFFLSSACQRSRELVLTANPLLRSGLILSPGGKSQDATQEDGLLSAEEVSVLRLDDTELVVLSGCDTARGASEAGEGLLGLRRAFHAAGARHVLSSLWPVEDSTTQRWMLRFYQARFQQGSGVARSVRAASLAELRARRKSTQSTHPFYWGGFVASGF
jgi:CHAT domain-containing protein